jgi:hypothetical protein
VNRRRDACATLVQVFARVHTVAATPEQADRGGEMVKSVYLPWARDCSGFRGLIRLVDRENGKMLVFTLWADAESLEATTPSAEEFALRIAEASGAEYLSLEDYEVDTFDIASLAIPGTGS